MPAVPLAQASTFYRIRTSSPTYTGYLADSKVKHPQSLPADIPARALVTIQNPVDPAAHWRLSGAPISYRGEWRFRFVNRATGLCLSAYTVVNQGARPGGSTLPGMGQGEMVAPYRRHAAPQHAYARRLPVQERDAQCVGRWSLPAHSQPARGEWDPAGHLRLLPDPNPLAMGAAPAVHGSVGPERDQNPEAAAPPRAGRSGCHTAGHCGSPRLGHCGGGVGRPQGGGPSADRVDRARHDCSADSLREPASRCRRYGCAGCRGASVRCSGDVSCTRRDRNRTAGAGRLDLAPNLAIGLPRRHRRPASRAVREPGRRHHVSAGTLRARPRSRLGGPSL